MMKKVLLGICFLFSFICSLAYAGGGITHMFIAQEAIAKIPDPQLRNLLLNNIDAYLVGAYYPDSGFIKGNTYGEDSHWDPFIFTFADYIKSQYKDPEDQNPKLVAFLFGCAAHVKSDIIIHWTFYKEMAREDFHSNDWETAHNYGDFGIDILVNLNKDRWFSAPVNWWVPVHDLVNVYHLMNKDQYTSQQIIYGNSVLAVAGYAERMISVPVYPYLEWKIPWTAYHYYNWPVGGMLTDEQSVADYQMSIWQRLHNPSSTHLALNAIKPPKDYNEQSSTSPVADFANEALASGAVSVTTKTNDDGSVEIQSPVVTEAKHFASLIKQLIAKII